MECQLSPELGRVALVINLFRIDASCDVVPVGKAGAWELAVRYSRISLNGGQIRGGKEDNVTFGLNWYFNDHLRLMADYVMVNSDRRGVSDNPNILDVRAQVAF